MRQARSAGQLPVRAQSGNSARPITGQQMMNSQRIMQGMILRLIAERIYEHTLSQKNRTTTIDMT